MPHAATPGQGTFAGAACGSGAQASLGSCLVALSFLSGTVGYGLSAPGPAGSPLVLGRTTDAGITWSSRRAGARADVGCARTAASPLHRARRPASPGVRAHLERTADGGATGRGSGCPGDFSAWSARAGPCGRRRRPAPPLRPNPPRSVAASMSPDPRRRSVVVVRRDSASGVRTGRTGRRRRLPSTLPPGNPRAPERLGAPAARRHGARDRMDLESAPLPRARTSFPASSPLRRARRPFGSSARGKPTPGSRSISRRTRGSGLGQDVLRLRS